MTGFLTFVGISALVIMTPGPDTAMTIRNTLLGGRKAGLFTALGVSLGLTIWALATSVGLVALLIASEPVFLAVNISAPRISSSSVRRRCGRRWSGAASRMARRSQGPVSRRRRRCARA